MQEGIAIIVFSIVALLWSFISIAAFLYGHKIGRESCQCEQVIEEEKPVVEDISAGYGEYKPQPITKYKAIVPKVSIVKEDDES
jgi:hypothetical protein